MLEQLPSYLKGDWRYNEPLSAHTTFRIGGPADAFYVPHGVAELKKAASLAMSLGIPVTIMGQGSNLLVQDGGIRGLVIKLAGTLDWLEIHGTEVVAGCGVLLSTLAHRAAEASLTGLEFAAGIPGTLGGAVSMNAGAYDGEMKDVVKSVRVLTTEGQEELLTLDELAFGYRQSVLQTKKLIALETRLELKMGSRELIYAKIEDLNRRRREKQPLTLPSAGSVFKRPPGHFAGTLIEQAGLKGHRIGGAEVSTLHAGFIVNVGQATAKDVKALIGHIQLVVKEKFGVDLEPEIRIIGEE